MIVKAAADSHPGRCSVTCTIKNLAKDYLLAFSLSLFCIPFIFILHIVLPLVIQQNRSYVKSTAFPFLEENKTILQNRLSTFAWPAKISDLVQRLLGEALSDCIKNGGAVGKANKYPQIFIQGGLPNGLQPASVY